ncbi:MAG: LytR C-terminal domain-containing protein [Candidatus Woesebacteria bacterium]|nr:LytR C-terminal domain-containing protein [Candidatus Woesebacteria bacterium]
MEEDQNPQETQTQPVVETPQESVSFAPIPVKQKSKSGLKTFLGIFILIIFVVGGFLIFKDNGQKSSEPTATPEVSGESVVVSSPTPTPEPVDKTKVVISIENGTGIVGEAAYIRDILKSAGYSIFKVGNATTTDNVTTTVTFSSSLAESVKTEITTKLNDIYKEVTVANSSTQTDDVLIVTGLRKGATAKPSASPSASPSTSPSPSPTATP